MGTRFPLLGHVICVNLMEIAKRREIIWLVRILELKIRKGNKLLLLFFLNLSQNGIPLIRSSYHA